jgi:hypothetical protein
VINSKSQTPSSSVQASTTAQLKPQRYVKCASVCFSNMLSVVPRFEPSFIIALAQYVSMDYGGWRMGTGLLLPLETCSRDLACGL